MKDVIAEFRRLCDPKVQEQQRKDRRPPERKVRGLPRWRLTEVAGTIRWELWEGRKLKGFAWTWKGRGSWQAVKAKGRGFGTRRPLLMVDLIAGTLSDCITRVRGSEARAKS
jgi:hypothetical protein